MIRKRARQRKGDRERQRDRERERDEEHLRETCEWLRKKVQEKGRKKREVMEEHRESETNRTGHKE